MFSDQNPASNFFSENNQVIDVVYDFSKSYNQFQNEMSNNAFSNMNIIENKIENIYGSIANVNERISTETKALSAFGCRRPNTPSTPAPRAAWRGCRRPPLGSPPPGSASGPSRPGLR